MPQSTVCCCLTWAVRYNSYFLLNLCTGCRPDICAVCIKGQCRYGWWQSADLHRYFDLPLRETPAGKRPPAGDALAVTPAQPNGLHHESSAIDLSNTAVVGVRLVVLRSIE